jgi:HTH-type transcriptional regulator / antitoxin MqsA
VTVAKEIKTQPCPECGGLMRYEKRDDLLSYKGHTKKVKTLGFWCTKCGEAIFTGDALVKRERAFQELKAGVDGVLTPMEVKAVRQDLKLSQRKAGELLGGGPRAFQKYESGEQAVSVPMAQLLRLLANDPKRLSELAKAGPAVRPARTRPRRAS